MAVTGVVDRDLDRIRLPRWGRVAPVDGVVPWLVLDDADLPVEPVLVFLRDFVARGNRPGSVRSYAFGLLRWWLRVVGVEWDRATSAEVRDLVLWLRSATKPQAAGRTNSSATAGTVNAVTGKRYLDDSYAPRTVRHSNAVVGNFYEFWIDAGAGPLLNPVARQRVNGRRSNVYHNPLQPFRPEAADGWRRAVARPVRCVAVSPGSGPVGVGGEQRRPGSGAPRRTGLRSGLGEQLIRVSRKGSGAEQWLPANPDAFVWLRLYFADVGTPGLEQPIWSTLLV